MDLTFNSTTEVSGERDDDFGAVLVCPDAPTMEVACEVLSLLRRHLAGEMGRLWYQWWTFEFLAVRELWERFAAQTATASMILVGVPEAVALPEHFAAWLKRLPDLRHQRPGALIAVQAPALNASDAEGEMLGQLQQAAALSRMDFFATRATVGLEVGPLRTNCSAGLQTRTKHDLEVAKPNHSAQLTHRNDSEAFREEIRRRCETPFRSVQPFGGFQEEAD